jgi:hypothetical protein
MTRALLVSSLMIVDAICYASRAEADPLRVTSGGVSAGFNSLPGPLDSEGMSLVGSGFAIGSSLEDEEAVVRLTRPPTLAPGALADFSGVLLVEDPVGGELNGSFGLLAAPFSLSFTASPMSLSCSGAGSSTACNGRAPFTFDARLTFTPIDGNPVMHHFIGGGTVEGFVARDDSTLNGAVRYTFEASPTPEPATLSLFTMGAIMAGAAVWRTRRRCCEIDGQPNR